MVRWNLVAVRMGVLLKFQSSSSNEKGELHTLHAFSSPRSQLWRWHR